MTNKIFELEELLQKINLDKIYQIRKLIEEKTKKFIFMGGGLITTVFTTGFLTIMNSKFLASLDWLPSLFSHSTFFYSGLFLFVLSPILLVLFCFALDEHSRLSILPKKLFNDLDFAQKKALLNLDSQTLSKIILILENLAKEHPEKTIFNDVKNELITASFNGYHLRTLDCIKTLQEELPKIKKELKDKENKAFYVQSLYDSLDQTLKSSDELNEKEINSFHEKINKCL